MDSESINNERQAQIVVRSSFCIDPFFFITNNTFNGGLKCPAIIEGSNEKGWVTFANNAMDGCERGAQIYLANALREV